MRKEYAVKSAYTEQTATVNKLLKEGWQPFSVVPMKKDGKPVFRMYFRKSELFDVEEFVAPQLEAVKIEDLKIDSGPLVEVLTDFFSEFQQMVINEHKSLIDKMSDLVDELKPRESSLHWRGLAPVEPGFDTHEGAQKRLREGEFGGEEREVKDDRSAGKVMEDAKEREEVLGDSFRVVDDVPPEVAAATAVTRTDSQNAAIEQIKSRHNVNVTVFRPDEHGHIKVLVENLVYTVFPDGTVEAETTNANTSSLMVD